MTGQQMFSDKPAKITLENREPHVECMVCSDQAAEDCRDLANTFARHFEEPPTVQQQEALLGRVNQVDEWTVCAGCQQRLSNDDKLRVMSLWIVLEGMRNWLRTEVRIRLPAALPAAPPVQLA